MRDVCTALRPGHIYITSMPFSHNALPITDLLRTPPCHMTYCTSEGFVSGRRTPCAWNIVYNFVWNSLDGKVRNVAFHPGVLIFAA